MDLKHKFNEQEVQDINQKVESEVVKRASDVLFVLALLFSVYGLMSTKIISKYDVDVTMWSNSWPRLLFNGIPFIALGLFLRAAKIQTQTKLVLWAVVQPIIFVIACCIYVWPLMYSGHLELYKYFHAANMFVITFGIIFVSPSRQISLTHIGSYSLFFLFPLLYITRTDSDLTSMIVNDYVCMTLGAAIAGQLTYRLRKKIAYMDAQIKSTLKPLVGNTIVSAIYNHNLEVLDNKKAYGLILTMDLRGFTQFLQTNSKEISSLFMKQYHFLVSTTVGKYGGFIHKTVGDAHLISFGLMDESADLSDIKDLNIEVAEAEQRKAKALTEHAIKMFDELLERYDSLKLKLDITDNLTIGAALASGPIQIQIQGDENYRQEVNIDGEAIIRSARLESYTKRLIKSLAPNSSMLILSPEILDTLKCDTMANIWTIENEDWAVRDYPHLKKLYYRTWGPNNSLQIKKRAS